MLAKVDKHLCPRRDLIPWRDWRRSSELKFFKMSSVLPENSPYMVLKILASTFPIPFAGRMFAERRYSLIVYFCHTYIPIFIAS